MAAYKQVKINLTPEDYLRIAKIAAEENLSLAELFRSRLSAKIENPPMRKKSVVYKSTDPKLLYELNRIGTNLNQIAKKLNSTGELERTALLKIHEQVMSLK